MKCKSCGAENSVNATKCEYCGNFFSKIPEEPVDPARAVAMKGADISFLKRNQAMRRAFEEPGDKKKALYSCLGCFGLLVFLSAVISLCCSC